MITEREAEGLGRLWALGRHRERDVGSRRLSNTCASHVGRGLPRVSLLASLLPWTNLRWGPRGGGLPCPPGGTPWAAFLRALAQGVVSPALFWSSFLGVPAPDQGPARDKESSSLPPGARVMLLKHAPPAGRALPGTKHPLGCIWGGGRRGRGRRALALHQEGPHP